MNGTILLTIAIIIFGLAYFIYGRYLTKLFGVDNQINTPALLITIGFILL